MVLEWSHDVKLLLDDARRLSLKLGHFEIVTLIEVYGALLSRLYGTTANEIETTLTTIAPPWSNDAVYLSPGGQTPSVKRAFECAMVKAQAESRAVTIHDIWDALPIAHTETIQHLDLEFGVDRQVEK